MLELKLDSHGKFVLGKKLVSPIPIGRPQLISEVSICKLHNGNYSPQGISGTNAFLLGNQKITETIDGPYTVWSEATGRGIDMNGPRRVEYHPVQYYKIEK